MTMLVVLLAASPCAGCHQQVHSAFAATRHAHAHDEPLFRASWQRVMRRPWCATCHDPLGGGRGLTCAVCHQAEAEHLDGHETRRTEAGDPDVCAHCHQFSAPEPRFQQVAMQDTVAEWRRARAAGEKRTCVDCHFRGVEHGTRAGHDPTALVVTSPEPGCVSLRAPDVGHSVPTGDPFHRLRLRFCDDARCQRVLATRWLERALRLDDAGVAEVASDTRVPAGVLGARTECFKGAAFWQIDALHAEPGLDPIPAAEVVRTIAAGACGSPRGDGGVGGL